MVSNPPVTPETPEPDALPAGRRSPLTTYRWSIVGLLFFASTINYLDRQTLSVVAPQLKHDFNLTNSQFADIVSAFFVAYAIMYTLSGKVMDAIGTRLGMALSIAWWSVAAALHSVARGFDSLRLYRFMLGVGEPGMFPAAVKTVRESFPEKQRALAIGIFNSGTSIGALIAPPVVTFLMLKYSWRLAFLATGSLGFLWVIAWLVLTGIGKRRGFVASAQQAERAASLRPKVRWVEILQHRQVWGILAGRTFADPAWYFYLTWLPLYLHDVRHVSLAAIGYYFALLPAVTGDVGNVVGGWLSGFLMRSGRGVIQARQLAMLATVIAMPVIYFGTRVDSTWVVVGAISLATMMHQSWSANITTLPADVCPEAVVGSVAGLAGTAGSLASVGFTLFVGWAADHHHYPMVFLGATAIYPIGWVLNRWLVKEKWVATLERSE